jgi:peptidoglycan-associated lipoprotein
VPATDAAKSASNSASTLNVDAEVANELARIPATRTVAEIEAAAAQPKNTEYYKADQTQVAPAQQVEKIEGLFYTVQVGVYSKPVAAALLQNVNPLNSELTETNKIRYTSGQFGTLAEAVVKREETRALGITDAFITVYYNGKRITLSEADLLLKEKGAGIIAK